MFPNPQDALPLPPHPNLEQYKKLAKELVKACKSEQSEAIGDWVVRWMEGLARLNETELTPKVRANIDRRSPQIEQFIRSKLQSPEPQARSCVLADAQFVIARSHGFLTWLRFVQHLESLSESSSSISRFESAADAIIAGDTRTLERLLREDPELIHARSTREHEATLLHYVSANGVEGYRQKSPQNAAAITEILLKAGAKVDATAVVYRGACTALELVATSAPPLQAGVQKAVIETLLAYGAAVDGAPGGPGMIIQCMGNGCREAAELLAERGARLTIESAAALGRLEVVRSFFNEDGSLKPNATRDEMLSAFLWACMHGRHDVIEFLLQHGAEIDTQANLGQTGLHWAVITADLDTIRFLLKLGAPLEVRNVYSGTVLGQALWSAAHSGPRKDYVAVIETLVAAGAKVPERHAPVNDRIDELLERFGSRSDDEMTWFGEPPKKKKKQQ